MGAAAVVGGVLAVTGGGSDSSNSGGNGSLGGGTLGSGAGTVRVLNWPLYIDPSENGATGTLDRFKKDTGVTAEYSEDFSDNNEVYAKYFEPYLGTGKTMDYDIVCPTNWMAARLKNLGWIEPLPLADNDGTPLIPNRVNLEDRFLTEQWNFGATYSLPWQAGLTGIAYNPQLTGREIKSVMDLLDPEFKGKVACLTEMRDTIGLFMMALGHDPSVLDEDAINEALDTIEQATKKGQFRAFTGNEYTGSLETGDFVACVAWSGDIVQLNLTRPDIKFVLPEEGAMSWYDTMVIPKGAPNGIAAAKWMNYVYDPVQAAQITAYVQYLSPVKGVRDELVKLGDDAAKLAESPILFPDTETQKRLRSFAPMPEKLDASVTDRFQRIVGG
ncbi:MAG: spermidine/putrescine ABC transporter substrate-binding protein [Actinomycetota bacterium]